MTPVGESEFGAALRSARTSRDLRQEDLADLLGKAGVTVSYQAIGGWERGESPPSSEKVFVIERCLELAPGTLSRLLGYLPVSAVPAKSFEEVVLADPGLDDRARDMLLAAYTAAVRRADRRKSGRS